MWQRMKRRGGKQGLIVLFEENGERKKENPNYLFHRTHTKKEREKNAVRNNIESERETTERQSREKRSKRRGIFEEGSLVHFLCNRKQKDTKKTKKKCSKKERECRERRKH